MNKLFPLPLYTFLKITFKNGGITGKGLSNTLPWILKTTLFEPLRWIELATKNKKIEQHQITKSPVFILGYYRSGTTYLQQLFMQDDRLGYMSNFQMIFPEIMLSFGKRLTAALETLSRLFRLQNKVHRVPLSWYFPGEEDVAMTTSLNPAGAQWGFFFPEKMNDYFEKYVLFEKIPDVEIEEWKNDFLTLLKKLSIANQGKQMLLKSPPNTARIKLLLSLFPGAKFIYIHRNPYDVYASNKRLWKIAQEIYTLGKTKRADVNTIIIDTYSKMMQRYLMEKDLVPHGQLTEIYYEDLIKSPVKSMRNIYESLQLDEFNYCENKMTEFAALQKKYRVLDHTLPGNEMRIISEKWEPYIRHWNYSLL